MPNLEELRLKIDTIDDALLKLLNERMNYVKRIGELKQSLGTAIIGQREKGRLLIGLKVKI